MPNTIVAVHAHPDEAIFTGGTLRRAVHRGWRTVVVFATAGEAGFARASGDTGGRPFRTGSFAASPIADAAARLHSVVHEVLSAVGRHG